MSLINYLFEVDDNNDEIIQSFQTKETLNKDFFNDDLQIHDEVLTSLEKVSIDFYESIAVEFFIYDVILTGSLSNYNWSKFSDVDLHILVDYNDLSTDEEERKVFEQLFDAKKNLWNEKNEIKIKNYDAEVYVQDINEPHVSSGVYSIVNRKWVVEPERDTSKINEKKIISKSDKFMKEIDMLSKSELNLDTFNKVDKLRDKLKDFRQSGLEKGGELSYENLTFKLLRRNGYIEKLMELKKKIKDKLLSL